MGRQRGRAGNADRPSGRLWKSITAGLLLSAVGLSLQPPPLEYRLEVPFIASPPRAARLMQINTTSLAGESIVLPGTADARGTLVELVGLRLEALQRLNDSRSADAPLSVVQERGVDQPTLGRLICRLSAPIRPDQIDALLDAISFSGEGEPSGDAEQLKARRWARWRVETYEHYVQQDADAPLDASTPPDARLVGFPSMTREPGSDRVPAAAASFSRAAVPWNDAASAIELQPSNWPGDDSAVRQLERWREELNQLDQQTRTQLREARGFIVAQQPPRQRPVTRDSLRPQLRTLLIAAVGGCLLVWFPWHRLAGGFSDKHRSRSSSGCQPVAVSEELPPYLRRLNDLGSLRLPASEGRPSAAVHVASSRLPTGIHWVGRFGRLGRTQAVGRLAERFGSMISWRVADSLVAFWGTIALTRFFIDEQWRMLARFEPLAALASLLQRLS